MKRTLLIEGMSCQHCVMAAEKAIGGVAGVSFVAVDLATKKAVVEGDNLDDAQLKEAVTEAGYEVVGIE